MNKVYNVDYGEQTTLNQLFQLIKESLIPHKPEVGTIVPEYGPFRKGDVRHSLANISRARQLLVYEPEYDVFRGMKKSIEWYIENTSATATK